MTASNALVVVFLCCSF